MQKGIAFWLFLPQSSSWSSHECRSCPLENVFGIDLRGCRGYYPRWIGYPADPTHLVPNFSAGGASDAKMDVDHFGSRSAADFLRLQPAKGDGGGKGNSGGTTAPPRAAGRFGLSGR